MPMSINDRISLSNSVKIISLEIDALSRDIHISYAIGERVGGEFTEKSRANFSLGNTGFSQLMEWIPNGTDDLKNQLLPLIYNRIANNIGEAPGTIDIEI